MYSVRDSRPGAGDALRREIAVPARMVQGPAHPRPPSAPRPDAPSRTTWRWVTATGLALVVLLSAWAFGPGGYVARTATHDLTLVATVLSVGGHVEARVGAGASWAPLVRGDVLRAGADVRTTSAGAVTLGTSDGVEVHVDALSRIDVPDARTIRFQFGSIEVDTRDRHDTQGGVAVTPALSEVRIEGGAGLYTVTRRARGAALLVLDGHVLANGRPVPAGECRVVVGAGLLTDRARCD